ncbi:MAG: thiamine diphosphokinase [Bacteroidia bacterium]
MSSHHIVKDNQEPALIIANGQACSFELMQQLLEWSPVVMVLDGALERVLNCGIKIDILLGDFDRLENPEDALVQQNIEIIHTPDQNKTDLEKGIELLIERGHKAINILWATGKRADHTFNNLTLISRYKHKASIVMYDDYSKIFTLPNNYVKWYPSNTNISLMPVGKVINVTTKGLKYNLTKQNLETGINSSSSNVTETDGLVEISYDEGNLLLMECID